MLKRKAAKIGAASIAFVFVAACDSGNSDKLDEYYERALADVERTTPAEAGSGARARTETALDAERAGLPAGFTVYPDAVVVSKQSIETGSGSGQIISMTTRASPAEVARFYSRQADRAGLSVDRSTDEQGAVTLEGHKPEGASFDLTAAQMGDGGTSANLMVLGTS